MTLSQAPRLRRGESKGEDQEHLVFPTLWSPYTPGCIVRGQRSEPSACRVAELRVARYSGLEARSQKIEALGPEPGPELEGGQVKRVIPS